MAWPLSGLVRRGALVGERQRRKDKEDTAGEQPSRVCERQCWKERLVGSWLLPEQFLNKPHLASS